MSDLPETDEFWNEATEKLGEIQRKNRCARRVCPDMAKPSCVCMAKWQEWLKPHRRLTEKADLSDAAEHAALDAEYREWCDRERSAWLAANPWPPGRPSPRDVREVCPHYQHRMAWASYIEPRGSAWWAERGWRLHWPPRDSNAPCKAERLEKGRDT